MTDTPQVLSLYRKLLREVMTFPEPRLSPKLVYNVRDAFRIGRALQRRGNDTTIEDTKKGGFGVDWHIAQGYNVLRVLR